MEIKTIKIKDLATNDGQIDGLPKNPRQIRDHRYDKLKKSIEDAPEMLQLRELLVYPHGGKFVIIGGNMRYRACKEIGYKELPCKVLDAETPVEKLRQYAIKDNENFGEYDWDVVANEWDTSELEDWGVELPTDWGAELDDEGIEKKEIVEDEIPENAETKCKKGEIWQLGRHRLMCGDSTKADAVAKLMNGERADLLFTSPPYSDMRAYNGGKDLSVVSLAKFIPTYEPYAEYQCVNLGLQVKDGEIVQYWDAYIASAKDCGYKLMGWNVWDKLTTGAISNQVDFITPTRHEWLFVFGKAFKEINRTWEKRPESIVKGDVVKKIRGNGDDFHSSTTGDHSQPYKKMESVLSITSEHGEIRSEHPAVFPVRLPAEYIAAFTNEGGIVIEPFGGSGTTMIACEQLNRTCYMMELDPHYCDVIIARWEKLSGGTAVKIEDV